MKISSIVLLAAAPLSSAWIVRWGPTVDKQGRPPYEMKGKTDLTQCHDMRYDSLKRLVKEPAPGYLYWAPNDSSHGCCLRLYGSDNGINHYCRRLEGGQRRGEEFCDGKTKLVRLRGNEGIGSFRVLGCKT